MSEVSSPDGLPIIQPTRDKVNELLDHVDRNADEVVGKVPPHYQEATVQLAAVNSVMAGCAPECFPVVLAALEASLEEQFNLYGALATTHPCWPSVVVNGPIIDEVGFNAGANAYGQGNRANATVGRSLTFIYMNVGGAVPNTGDKATQGGPHKFGLCVAENEAESPWDPLHVERGYDPDQSAVTVVASEAPHNINDHISESAAGIVTTAARSMAVPGTNLAYLNERGEPHLVLSPEHASTIARDGWTKKDVKQFLYDTARIPMYDLKGRGMYDEKGGGWPKRFNNAADHTELPIAESPEKFIVTVTGGAGRQSLFHPSFGDTESVTRTIPE